MTIAVIKRARGVVIKSGVNSAEVRRQAELAEADADRAKAEADRAETEKLGSESARDAAIAYLNPYADQAAGEAATSEGELFSYLDANDEVALAKRTAGGSDLLPVYFGASKVGLSDGATAQQAIAVAATPTALLASTASLPVGATVRTADGHVYDVVSGNEHLTTAGGVKLVVKPSPDGRYNIRAFGAVGDYDAATEPAGKLALSATDNYNAINAARLAFENYIEGGELVFPAPGDYWSSNMPRFRLSNFTICIEKGAVLRTTVPTSFGTTIYLGEAGEENLRIYGGGTVRNHLPDVDSLPLWETATVYAAGTYVRNSLGHAYYTVSGGTSGPTEPTALAVTSSDGGVTWRDALNDNGISVHGNNVEVIGMNVPEANNKGITAQMPPWENVTVRDCVVGSTYFSGIELKGNQGLAGQEALFAKNGLVENCKILDAGGIGIHVEQPSAGVNFNQRMTVRGNVVVKAGYREGAETGIRVNRCTAPIIIGNQVLDAAGNGIHIKECSDPTGDIYIENFGIIGLHLQGCGNWDFSRTIIKQGGTASSDAIRETSCSGQGHYGRLKVTGGGYAYAFRSAARNATVSASSLSLQAGSSGRYLNALPLVPTGALTGSSGSDFAVVENSQNIAATGRADVISHSGRAQLLGGVVSGNAACRVEIIVDGGSVLTLIGSLGPNGTRVINLPPIAAGSGLIVRVNNNSGSAATIAWSAIWRTLA